MWRWENWRNSAFRWCGLAGLALALLVSGLLAARLGLSLAVVGVLAALACAVFFALAILNQVIIGRDRLVYYHHEIAIFAIAGAALALMRAPVLPYLDLAALGLAAFLACGRIGCLLTGCCHGRPFRWGVRYTRQKSPAGFLKALAGVRLAPVQLFEALWTAGALVAGIRLALHDAPPGGVFSMYLAVYGLGRFVFEFLRGDPDRRYLLGFSEAQWTSLVLMAGCAAAEALGLLPWNPYHVAAASAAGAAMLLVLVTDNADRRLFLPRHICQVAQALEDTRNEASAGDLYIAQTAQGVHISASVVPAAEIFSFSRAGESFSAAAARRFALLIVRLRRAPEQFEFLKGERGVWHLVLPGEGRAHGV